MPTTYNKSFSSVVKIILFIWIVSIPLKNTIYQVSIVALILLFFVDLYRTKSFSIMKNIFLSYKHIFLSFGLIILSMTLSNTFGIGAPKAWYLQFMFIIRYGFIFYILIYFYAKNYITPKIIILMILASLSLQGVDGLYQHFYDIDFINGHQVSNGAWLTGAVFYYNPFGMLMAIGGGLTISLLIEHKQFNLTKFQIALLIVLSLMFTYDLLYSLSRASWVFFGIFISTMAILHYHRIDTKIFLFSCLLLLLIIIFVSNDHDIFVRFQQLLQGDSSNRYDIWKNSIQAFLERPILGYGLNSFKEVVSQEYSATHNNILEILLYMGILGFITFSFMLLLLFKEIKRTKNATYLSFYIALMAISQFDYSITSSKIFLSVLTLFAFLILSHKIKNNALQ